MSPSREATQIDEENIGNTNTAPGPLQHQQTQHSEFVTADSTTRDIESLVEMIEIIGDIYKSIAK